MLLFDCIGMDVSTVLIEFAVQFCPKEMIQKE